MKAVFMGTPEFAVPSLKALNDISNVEVVGVYTQPDRKVGRGQKFQPPPVKQFAIDQGLPVFQPEKLSSPEEIEKLSQLGPDIIFVVAYGHILKQAVLDIPRLGCVNVHASLLPRWRGAAPIQWSLLSGDQKTGVCSMEMVRALDAGNVYLVRETEILKSDTSATLFERLSQLGGELIEPTLQGLESGTLKGQPQDESKVMLAPKLTKEMQWLDTSEDAESLELKVRAFTPWPGASIKTSDGERLKIHEADVRVDIDGPQGKLFEKFGMLLLGTSKGALELKRVQLDGKKPFSAAEFLNGFSQKMG